MGIVASLSSGIPLSSRWTCEEGRNHARLFDENCEDSVFFLVLVRLSEDKIFALRIHSDRKFPISDIPTDGHSALQKTDKAMALEAALRKPV